MSSSDYTKQLQIITSKAYMNTKLTCLFDMREIKLNLIKAEEIKQIYDRKINQLIIMIGSKHFMALVDIVKVKMKYLN